MNPLRRMTWLRWWWPALVWAALIAFFSTDMFSGEHTSRVIIPLLRLILPTARHELLLAVHHYIRKAAHVTEFFVFSLLLLRGIRAARSGWRVQWAVAAVAIAAGWASLDELHQAFVPTRVPSIFDVLIDVSGAATAQIVCAAAVLFRSRRPGAGQGAPTDSPHLVV